MAFVSIGQKYGFVSAGDEFRKELAEARTEEQAKAQKLIANARSDEQAKAEENKLATAFLIFILTSHYYSTFRPFVVFCRKKHGICYFPKT